MSPEPDDIILVLAFLGLIVGLAWFWKSLQGLRLKRMIEGLATSKARSLAMGTVQLFGKAELLSTMNDPVYGEPCAFYRIEVQEQRGSDDDARWVTIHRSDSATRPFLLADESGRVPVLPDGSWLYCHADVSGTSSGDSLIFGGAPLDPRATLFARSQPGSSSTSPRRMTAYIIREGDPVYVLGYAYPLDKPLASASTMVLVRRSPDGLFVISESRKEELLSELGANAVSGIIGGPILAITCAAYLARRFAIV